MIKLNLMEAKEPAKLSDGTGYDAYCFKMHDQQAMLCITIYPYRYEWNEDRIRKAGEWQFLKM